MNKIGDCMCMYILRCATNSFDIISAKYGELYVNYCITALAFIVQIASFYHQYHQFLIHYIYTDISYRIGVTLNKTK